MYCLTFVPLLLSSLLILKSSLHMGSCFLLRVAPLAFSGFPNLCTVCSFYVSTSDFCCTAVKTYVFNQFHTVRMVWKNGAFEQRSDQVLAPCL